MTTILPILLALAGAGLAVRGVRREWRSLCGPVTEPTTGAGFVRALRSVLAGGALVAISVGWAFDLRAVWILGLVIGAEEMLEIGVVLAAMRDAERRPGSPWRFHVPHPSVNSGGRFARNADTPSRKSPLRAART